MGCGMGWCGTGRGGARWQGRGMEGGKGKDGGGMGERKEMGWERV